MLLVAVKRSREKERERRLDADDLLTLECMNHLATIYWETGRWKEAEGADSQLIHTRSRILDSEHPWTRSELERLACALMAMERT